MRSWLFEARTKSGMTQAEVAKKIGISESYYAFIEGGQRQKKMEITLASKLSAIFDIPIKKIVDLENAPDEAGEARDDDA